MKREAWEVRAARLRSRGAMTRIQPGFFFLIQSWQAWGGRRRKGQKRKTGRPVCQDKKSFSSFLFFFIFLIHNTLTYLVFFKKKTKMMAVLFLKQKTDDGSWRPSRTDRDQVGSWSR
jgi:hypothetical protein